VLKFIK